MIVYVPGVVPGAPGGPELLVILVILALFAIPFVAAVAILFVILRRVDDESTAGAQAREPPAEPVRERSRATGSAPDRTPSTDEVARLRDRVSTLERRVERLEDGREAEGDRDAQDDRGAKGDRDAEDGRGGELDESE